MTLCLHCNTEWRPGHRCDTSRLSGPTFVTRPESSGTAARVRVVEIQGAEAGHVWTRPDGTLVRCGGPFLCSECAKALKVAGEALAAAFGPAMREKALAAGAGD